MENMDKDSVFTQSYNWISALDNIIEELSINIR